MSLLFGLAELFFKIRILVFRLKSSWDSQVNRLIWDGWQLCLSFWRVLGHAPSGEKLDI